MKKENFEKAEELAKRPYLACVFPDETTDGELVYVALVPEMPGCVAHGDTLQEAMSWLESAKVDHIWFLLDHGLEVPEPKPLNMDMPLVFDMSLYTDEADVDEVADRLPAPESQKISDARVSIMPD